MVPNTEFSCLGLTHAGIPAAVTAASGAERKGAGHWIQAPGQLQRHVTRIRLIPPLWRSGTRLSPIAKVYCSLRPGRPPFSGPRTCARRSPVSLGHLCGGRRGPHAWPSQPRPPGPERPPLEAEPLPPGGRRRRAEHDYTTGDIFYCIFCRAASAFCIPRRPPRCCLRPPFLPARLEAG